MKRNIFIIGLITAVLGTGFLPTAIAAPTSQTCWYVPLSLLIICMSKPTVGDHVEINFLSLICHGDVTGVTQQPFGGGTITITENISSCPWPVGTQIIFAWVGIFCFGGMCGKVT